VDRTGLGGAGTRGAGRGRGGRLLGGGWKGALAAINQGGNTHKKAPIRTAKSASTLNNSVHALQKIKVDEAFQKS